jgi:predicted transcriptional regulator
VIKRLFGVGASFWRGEAASLTTRLGHLETEVMEIVWRGGELAVRDVQGQLARSVAYTTVMTTLDRLFKKGYARRRRQGRAYVYTAAFAKHELEVHVTSGLLKDLLAGGAAATPVLSNLVDAVADRDGRLLDELERLVRDKRQRLKRGRG